MRALKNLGSSAFDRVKLENVWVTETTTKGTAPPVPPVGTRGLVGVRVGANEIGANEAEVGRVEGCIDGCELGW